MQRSVLAVCLAMTASVGVGPLWGEPGVPDAEHGVRLAWHDPLQALPCGFEVVTRAVDEVFRPLGLAVSWRQGDGERRPGEVSIVLLRKDWRPSRRGDAAMGLASRDPGLRVAWVFLDAVQYNVGIHDRRLSAVDAEELGQAVGRVAAHEAIHVLLPEQQHTVSGLMSATLGRRELLGGLLTLDSVSAQRLRARLTPSPQGPTLAARDVPPAAAAASR